MPIVLDVTVMNLALPSAQRALGFTNARRQWIVTAYSLSSGSLLLFGGRLADLIGRKVTFLGRQPRTPGARPGVSGVALLPMAAVTGVMANAGNIVLMPRFGPKPLVIAGLPANAAGMAWLTRIGVHSGYAPALPGPLVVTGSGSGLIFSAAASTATFGVAPHDAGIAPASVSTGQQPGGAIGTALLNTIAASATTSYLASHLHGRPSPLLVHLTLIHGYTTVFWSCAGIFAAGAVIRGALPRRGPLTRPQDTPAREPARQATPARP